MADQVATNRLRITVAAIITGAWAVSFVVNIFVPSYDIPYGVQGLMAGVSAYLFGPALTSRFRGGGDND